MLPKQEIEWLLKEKYNGVATEQFNKDVERLKKGEPLAYIIGFTEFLGCKIDLSKKPLIPRPETEFWVGQEVEKLAKKHRVTKPHGSEVLLIDVLDIFSGSGCAGISIMRHLPTANVVFADKEKNAVEQIKINIKLNQKLFSNSRELGGIANGKNKLNNYKIIQTDVFKNITGKFDYIFANPPYIPTTRKSKIQKSVLKYEPNQALFGGKDGLFYIKKFLAEAKNFLNPRGKIYMEFDSHQKRKIEKLLKKNNYKSWHFFKDQYGKWRWVELCY